MLTIGIDPGATIGVCVYDADGRCVLDTLTTRSPACCVRPRRCCATVA